MNKPKKYFKEFDLTENKTGKVMAYLIENGDSKVPYDLVIMSNGVVVANDDSSFMFSFPNIEEIEGLSNIDFRETTTMKGMFIGNEKLDSVDVKSIEMDNVIDVSYMFFGCDNVSYTKLDFELNDVNSLLMFTDKLYDEIKVSAKSDLDLNYQSSLSKGIYFINSTASNEFPIYFYRGNIKNNNVLFGGFCWKIVRTTDTGGIKLIYNGIPSVDGSCNSTGVDTQIGTSVFNSKTNFIHSGYMYGVEHSVKKESIRSYNYGLISELSMNNNSFYYSDSLKYENNMYVLNDPVLVEWNNNYNDLIGKYTCLNGTSTSCSSASVVVDSTSSKMMYARLFNGEILDNIAISKKYIINSNGEFELVDPLFISYSDWYKNYMSYVDYFSCFNSNITSNLKNIVCKFGSKISNESKSTYIATTYLKGKDILFGSDVKYENGVYTLIDTVKVDECYYCDRLNTYLKKHYTCFDNDGVCTNVYYIKKDGAHMEYFTLTNGEKIDDILQKNMTNMYDSDIKKVIDNWFEYSLINYTNDLEDTIWCNDRSISEENYFDINYDFSGGIYLKFGNYRNLEKNTFVPDFKCSKNDSFTVNDNVGNGNLKYPIGLLTAEELSLAGHGKKFYSRSNYLYSGTAWWTMTPSIDDGFIRLYCMYSYTPGKLFEYQSTFNGGVRPAVSLKHDISYSAGDGTVNNPYIIE